MKTQIELLELQSPDAYAEGSPYKKYLPSRAIAEYWDTHPALGERYPHLAAFKTAFRAGQEPQAALEIIQSAQRAEDEQAAAQHQALLKARAKLPATLHGYTVRVTDQRIEIEGPYDEDLRPRLKRIGVWAGEYWVVPLEKSASVLRVFANWEKARNAKPTPKPAEKPASPVELPEPAPIPEIAGQYGPAAVERGNSYWIITFPYADEDWFFDLKSGIKSLRGIWQPNLTRWLVPLRNGEALLKYLRATESNAQPIKPREKTVEPQNPYFIDINDASVGDVVRHRDQWVRVVKLGKDFRIEDHETSAYGLMPGEDYWARRAYYEPLGEEEAAARDAEVAAEKARVNAINDKIDRAKEIFREILRIGEKPDEDYHLPGRYWFCDSFDNYGCGWAFCVTEDFIWYVKNNGRDSDDWTQNNILTGGAGAMGWRIPFDSSLAEEIRALDVVLKPVIQEQYVRRMAALHLQQGAMEW